ncbi:hypothetical protein [Xanthomonas campestris]|uniref:hypothetical protein n=1 Tax=Xanthomonas campestris TaxID=339 RepID=UPI00096C15C9|nr:hypothetical protein [Xanthomonas campestris]MCF8826467.1 hypothetical protein [Xanthomonas campestris pv. raphani]MEA9878462.1 hypothetical protein [Xanthomonas campestris pv. raphani]MEA9894895.1 hypothetical protein [Xanthomonas campestris pv. raphani]MEA9934523.1 hypothetical protein [Xanthomonas campestris pv. raphani]WDJ20100.1 hypothetical protein JH264_10715 [Xanthomonas campestris pv. raphani]
MTTTEKPIAHEWVSTAYIVREGGAVVEWILDAGRSHDFHKAREAAMTAGRELADQLELIHKHSDETSQDDK